MVIDYRTQGVCSQRMLIDVEDGVVRSLQVLGGCDGNLQDSAGWWRGSKWRRSLSVSRASAAAESPHPVRTSWPGRSGRLRRRNSNATKGAPPRGCA